MTKAKIKIETIAKPAPRLVMVVYGYDDDKKPRAAKFAKPEFQLAKTAAALMNLSVFEGEAKQLGRALRKIPLDKIYASGYGFVPNVRRSKFDTLVEKLSGIKSKV